MRIELAPIQKHTLSRQMQQSLDMLQMATCDLFQYIRDITMDNPLIELEFPECESTDVLQQHERVRNEMERFSELRQSGKPESTACNEYWQKSSSNICLKDQIREQLYCIKLTHRQRLILEYLIGCMDEAGYLKVDSMTAERDLNGSLSDIEECVKILQGLEPAGVGAHDLGECLCLQLQRNHKKETLAYAITRDHIDLLLKCQYNKISKILHVSIEKVRKACEMLLELNPKPCNGINSGQEIQYIVPDIIVTCEDGRWKVRLNKNWEPKIHVNDYYLKLMRDKNTTDETSDYIINKYRQFKWVRQCIERRRSTLVKCAEVIVRGQQDFFQSGHEHLHPLQMTDIAQEIGVHSSTISRALSNKYIESQWGIFEMSHFFPVQVGDSEEINTREGIIKKIKEIVDSEDKRKPFSDNKIAQMLAENNIYISRRTVTKYRESIMIPATSGRRRVL